MQKKNVSLCMILLSTCHIDKRKKMAGIKYVKQNKCLQSIRYPIFYMSRANINKISTCKTSPTVIRERKVGEGLSSGDLPGVFVFRNPRFKIERKWGYNTINAMLNEEIRTLTYPCRMNEHHQNR